MAATPTRRHRPVSDPDPGTVPMGIRIPTPLADRLRRYSDRRKTTMTAVVIEALDDYLTAAGRSKR